MRGRTLLLASLRHYWRANAAVVLGVAAAAARSAARSSSATRFAAAWRPTALERLGRTTHVVEAQGFFREGLADDLASRPALAGGAFGAAPVLALRGAATHGSSRRRAGDVLVYGVDDRFWAFHGLPAPELSRPAARC